VRQGVGAVVVILLFVAHLVWAIGEPLWRAPGVKRHASQVLDCPTSELVVTEPSTASLPATDVYDDHGTSVSPDRLGSYDVRGCGKKLVYVCDHFQSGKSGFTRCREWKGATFGPWFQPWRRINQWEFWVLIILVIPTIVFTQRRRD
jgi:hypothetical protein